MLIQNLNPYLNKPIKGAIHIGAHLAEEKPWYDANSIKNVIWIDANEQYYNQIKDKVGSDLVIITGVGNENGKFKFNISNNGQSSSLLEFDLHKIHHPDVRFVTSIEIDVKRMVDIIDEFKIDITNYNFLNLDIQGSELDALKSFDNLLNNIDYIYTEVNSNYLYKNCALIHEIDDYLKEFYFERVKTEMTHWEWGDALYVKK